MIWIPAIGSLSAALLSAKLDARRGVRFILKFAFLFGASLIVTSIAPNYILYAVALPFVGMLALTMMI
jgi:hypothetical protein